MCVTVIDVRMVSVARGIYVISIVGVLLLGLALSTGGNLNVMGMAVSGCLLVGLLASDTDPDSAS